MYPKKKKLLKDLTFDHADAHIALVGPIVGGPANMQETLFLKSAANYPAEVLEKASQIIVTLSIEEYLERFYGLYWDDAEVLATALGFTTLAAEKVQYDYADDYRRYIDEKVGSISVLKSLKEGDAVKILADMKAEDYLQLLQDQALLEKTFSTIAKAKESGATAPDTQQNASVEKTVGPSGSVNKKKENMQEIEVMQKSLDDQKVELAKALELVELFKQEKKQAVVKSRKDKLHAVIKNTAQAETLFKAVGLVEADADFEEVIKALASIQELADKSELFKSVGVDGEPAEKTDADFSEEVKIKKSLQAKISARNAAK